MAQRGGIASKLGTQYERNYAIWKLAALLSDQIESLKWEPASDEAGGADIDIMLPGGIKEHIQLKRQNRAIDRWTPASLDQAGVLAAAARHLHASSKSRYRFVSSISVPHLADICDELTRHDGDNAQFVQSRVRDLKERRSFFDLLLSKWGLDPSKPDDETKAILWLRAMSFEVIEKGSSETERVRQFVHGILSGNPETAVGLIAQYLEDNIGKTITAQPLLAYLDCHGHRPRDLARDPKLRTTINNLRDEFIQALSDLLVRRVWIPRTQVQTIVDRITGEDPPRFVLVHGKAGTGKSAVILKITEALHALGIATLPLSLSAHPMDGDPIRYGETLGLEASPAAALKAIAHGDRSVLIVDQLDAIVLMSGGATSEWRRCASMLREAISDPNSVVVVACRTFDLDYDANIKRWRDHIAEENPGRVMMEKVGDLSKNDIRPVLKGVNITYESLTPRLQRLLLHPGTLDAWYTLAHKGDVRRDLATHTQLIDALVKHYRKEAVSVPSVTDAEVHQAIQIAKGSMERSGRLQVSESEFDACQAAMHACCSVGLFIKTGASVGFPHQSYLDYLIARDLLTESGGNPESILKWLKRDQSLERRDQLRQLLFLLHDTDATQAVQVSRAILFDPVVRFHLKLLVLGVLREIEPISPEHVQLIDDLVDHDDWRDHAVSRVLRNSVPWFHALYSNGTWSRLLENSPSDERAGWLRTVLWYMASCPNEVDALIVRIIDDPKGIEMIGSAVQWADPSEDSPLVAEVRHAQVRAGKWSVFDVLIDQVAEKDALRMIRLVDCMVRGQLRKILSNMSQDTEEQIDAFRESSLEKEVPQVIRSHAATAFPVFAQLVILCERVHHRVITKPREANGFSSSSYRLEKDLDNLAVSLRRLTAYAASGLADINPNALKVILNSYRVSQSISFSTAVALGLSQCSSTVSDEALEWIFADVSRLSLRDRDGRDQYGLAADVIRQHSKKCSPKALQRLVSRLLSLHPEEEKKLYRNLIIKYYSKGFWGHYSNGQYVPSINPIGRAQHLLLGAISTNRRSKIVAEKLRVWDAKFGGPAAEESESQPRGGMVGSPIPDDKLHRVSDGQWLDIVSRDWGAGPRNWKNISPGQIAESSHMHFANSFGEVAKQQPARCVELAARFPASAPAEYFARLWNTLADKECDLDSCDRASLDKLLDRAQSLNDRELLKAACWAIERHPHFDWGEPGWRLLYHAAEHEDPKPEEIPVLSGVGDQMRPNFETSSINCVRGVAAGALAAIVLGNRARYQRVLPAARKLAADPHPAVRIAAAALAMAAYNVESGLGIELLRRIVDTDDDRVLAGHRLNRLIGRARWCDRGSSWTKGEAHGVDRLKRHWKLFKWYHTSPLCPLIARMSKSDIESVALNGSHWIAAERIQFGLFRRAWRSCVKGTVVQRKAIAGALCQLVTNDASDRVAAEKMIVALFNDTDKDVRLAAADVFHQDGVLESYTGVRLASAFIGSRSFVESAGDLIRSLSEGSADLANYQTTIFCAAERFAGELSGVSRDARHRLGFDARDLSSLLLRLYDTSIKSDDRSVASACLDRWDSLLMSRVGDAERHLDALS